MSTGRWSSGSSGCSPAWGRCKGKVSSPPSPFHGEQSLIEVPEANHFYRYAPEKIDYAIKRYHTETKRLYQVLNDRLAAQNSAGLGLWVVGGKYSIADLCCFSWVNWAEWAGVETKPFPELQKWLETIQQRPAVQRGVDVPTKFEMKEKMRTKEGEEEYAKHHSNWVLQGMQADQQKHQ